MVIKGELALKHDTDDYIILTSGRLVNLTEYLNLQLLEEVHMKISKTYDKQVILDVSGKLIKDKTQPKLYLYHIDNVNIDDVLWNLVGSKVEIELNNISKQ